MLLFDSLKLGNRLKWLQACGSGLMGMVVKSQESRMSKEKIVNILIAWSGNWSRLTRKCKEAGGIVPCERKKCRAKKLSGEVLLGHVLKNPLAALALEERAPFFSTKRIHEIMKIILTNRKNIFFY